MIMRAAPEVDVGHHVWSFLSERAAELGGAEAGALRAVLAEHAPRDEYDTSCAGCGYVAILRNGSPIPRASALDFCPTLRALAWRWHEHRDWRHQWTLPHDVPLDEWPPGENCFCAKGEVLPHRRGTRRRCRPRRAERREAERAGVA
jgi:hypothetical protein